MTARSGGAAQKTAILTVLEPNTVKSPHLTDLGLVERFFDRHRYAVRYCEPLGGWFVWTGTHWSADAASEVWTRAADTVRAMYAQAANISDIRDRTALVDFARRSEARRSIEAVVALAGKLALDHGVYVAPSAFDAAPYSLNTSSGIVDLKTGTLRPHDRAALCSKVTSAPYNASADTTLWESFLSQSIPDAEVRAFVQRAAGSALIGRQIDERLYCVVGPGNSGKTTFARAVQSAMGSYATTASISTFLEQRHGATPGGAREDVARLAGMRFVVTAEPDEGAKLAVGLVKTLTGGDVVRARHLYSKSFEFAPQFSLFLVANSRPRVTADDSALWRRIVEIRFDHVVPEEQRDPELKARLCNPEGEGPGVLRWLVQGCLDYQTHGLGIPDTVKRSTENYRAEVDVLGSFLAEETEQQPKLTAPAGELYARYKQWAERSGERVICSNRVFRQRMEARGFEQHHSRTGSRWLGLALLHESEPR